MAAVGGFAEDSFVFAEFAEEIGAFDAELVGIGFEFADEGVEGVEAILGSIPLRGWETLEQVGIAAALLDEEGHGVFVG